jgi:hypothetical protein
VGAITSILQQLLDLPQLVVDLLQLPSNQRPVHAAAVRVRCRFLVLPPEDGLADVLKVVEEGLMAGIAALILVGLLVLALVDCPVGSSQVLEQIGVAAVPFFLHFCHLLANPSQLLHELLPLFVLHLHLPVDVLEVLVHPHSLDGLIRSQLLLEEGALVVPPLPDVLDLVLDVFMNG